MADALFSITVKGAPVPKGRPRFRIVKPRGKPQFVTVYTDAPTAAYEKVLAEAAQYAMRGRKPLDEALTVMVEAFIEIPGSWSAPKRAKAMAGDIAATSRPDADNYAKIALDALNKIVWSDDSLIVSLHALKLYSAHPRMRITAWAWDDLPPKEPEMI